MTNAGLQKTRARRRRSAAAGLIGALGLALAWAVPAAAAPKVVVSVLPLHSLAAGLMEGVGSPGLLIEGGGSPHSYSLSPRKARALGEAELVFWIGPALETFLDKPLAALAQGAEVIALADPARAEADGPLLLETRRSGAWASPDDDHGEEGHEEPDASWDPHLWLDPANAAAMAGIMAGALAKVDPDNAARYRDNRERLAVRLAALDDELTRLLATVKDRPYVVFHDAYQYFERHYGLNAVGAITLGPQRGPGARRLSEVRRSMRETGAFCVFAEPQFKPALAATVIEGTAARVAVLDPLGADLTPGPDAYFELMRGLARSLTGCLSASG